MRHTYLLLSIFILISCEKFTGYNYDSESIADQSRVYGTIRNIYNSTERVVNAHVEIGYITTRTDSSGDYDVDYIISTDDNRNKPVEIFITAPNYHDLQTDFLVFPPESNIDLYMEYGAPIIEKIWIGVPGKIVHQVLVSDYQGIDNIQSVTTGIYYVKFGDQEVRIETIKMKLYMKLSDNSAYYNATALPTIPNGWFYDSADPTHIQFTVTDLDSFVTLVDQKYSNIMSPTPLFPTDDLP